MEQNVFVECTQHQSKMKVCVG